MPASPSRSSSASAPAASCVHKLRSSALHPRRRLRRRGGGRDVLGGRRRAARGRRADRRPWGSTPSRCSRGAGARSAAAGLRLARRRAARGRGSRTSRASPPSARRASPRRRSERPTRRRGRRHRPDVRSRRPALGRRSGRFLTDLDVDGPEARGDAGGDRGPRPLPLRRIPAASACSWGATGSRSWASWRGGRSRTGQGRAHPHPRREPGGVRSPAHARPRQRPAPRRASTRSSLRVAEPRRRRRRPPRSRGAWSRGPAAPTVDVIVPREILRQKERTQRIFNVVTGAIAAISLLVGGIGIMNIMLASVAERTREVGVRRALGATRRDIAAQFLVESSLLTATGGVLGALLGLAGSIAHPAPRGMAHGPLAADARRGARDGARGRNRLRLLSGLGGGAPRAHGGAPPRLTAARPRSCGRPLRRP